MNTPKGFLPRHKPQKLRDVDLHFQRVKWMCRGAKTRALTKRSIHQGFCDTKVAFLVYIYIYIHHPVFSRDRPQCLRWWLGFGSMSGPHISLSMTGFEKFCVWNAVFGWPLSISFKRHPLNDVFTGRKALDEVAQIWRSQQKHRGGAKKPTVAGTVPCSKIDVWFSRNRHFRVIFMYWSWCFLSLFYWQLLFLCGKGSAENSQ